MIPRALSTSTLSPNYDKTAIAAIDRVYVDGDLCPECVAYDMDGSGSGIGWAIPKIDGVWQPRRHGVVTVTLKQGARL